MLASPSDDQTIRIWDAKTGECLRTLEGHKGNVYSVSFDPAGRILASGSSDKTVRLWDVINGTLLRTLEGHTGEVTSVVFESGGRTLASGSEDKTVKLWHSPSGLLTRTLTAHTDYVRTVAFDPAGRILASGSDDRTVKLWEVESGRLLRILEEPNEVVYSVSFDPTGHILASGSGDKTVKLWDASRGRLLRTLEGHTNTVNHVAFMFDGQLVASKGSIRDNTVRLWSSETGICVAVIPEPASDKWSAAGLAFHPFLPLLATVGFDPNTERDQILHPIHIWELNLEVLGQAPSVQTGHYVNAKVVLLGDTGVGKSGLSLVLNDEPFEATDSTPGRRVSTFQSQQVQIEGKRKQTRETLLWDLAGQPGYRVIHQLHLNEVAVALVVFDARSETDPLAGVGHWERSLRLAQQREGAAALPMKKFLVSARADRGTVSVSKERLDSLLKEFAFDGYFETSAKEGWQISELRAAIEQGINWDALPEVSSSVLFADIKAFLLNIKRSGQLIAPAGQLHDEFAQAYPEVAAKESSLRDQFDTCVGRLENRDLIRRLSFGGYVLLQPELLDAYASAMVNAAKEEPEGLGSIPEDVALAGQFFVPKEQRIEERGEEQLLLHATVEELVRHDLALRESAADGRYLVFPSQFNRDYEEAPEPKGKVLAITFDGPVQSLYSTLAVRLGHSGLFTTGRAEMWRNAAVFTSKAGGKCGLYLHEFAEARGRLVVFYDQHEGRITSDETRYHFEEFVLAHVRRRSLEGTAHTVRFFVCQNCGDPVPDAYVKRLRERGLITFDCPCGSQVSLPEPSDMLRFDSKVEAMDQSADRHRDFEMFVHSARGETSTESFISWAGDVRVTLAVVFTDIIGSTALQQELKEYGMNEMRRYHFAQSRKLIEEHKGREIKTIGDSFMAAFRSVDKALDYARALQTNPGHPQVQIRAAVHIGTMQVEETDVFGGAVNFAARVLGNIKGAEIWLSDRAKADVDSIAEPRHVHLQWVRHDNVPIKGFTGGFTLWSLNNEESFSSYSDLSEPEADKLDRAAFEAELGLPALAVRRVLLENIRGFRNLDIELSSSGTTDRFVLVLGDNATGKTTLLRAIALAFCDEASAAGLINPADFLRSGAEEGLIRIEFAAQPTASRSDEKALWVETRLSKNPSGEVKLNQKVNFSRKRLFVGGYGPSRLSFGREQEVEYASKAAVLTLFSRDASLMHPELVLRRLASTGERWEDIAARIDMILHLPAGSVRLEPGGGMSIVGPHSLGEPFPFTNVGDGYLSSVNWVLDLCGSWMTFVSGVPLDSISGVVLLDELEQHLHPTWQREIVRALHHQFPGIQFIATTHSALCALGTTAISSQSQVILLRGDEDAVECVKYPPPNAQSVNQVLTSSLFDLSSASSFGIAAYISSYARLKSLSKRTLEQETELRMLREILEGALGPFEDKFHSDLERVIHEVAANELATAIQERGGDKEILGFEIRARLRELFDLGSGDGQN
jgi:WD40 repeat protein/class 3 adenylate cyclase/energy-coupling factor transporter ATP-binding protein EcfA2